MGRWYRGLFILACFVFSATCAQAATFQSGSYKVDGSLGDSISGINSSGSYRMVSTGGASIMGNGAGGSYKIGQGYSATQERSLQLSVQPEGQSLYLPLDENNGKNAYDASAESNNGTLVNSPAWAAGKIGSSLTFSANHSVNVPKSASVTPTDSLSLEAWINPTSLTLTTASQTIFSVKETGGYALLLTGITSDGCAALKICFMVYAGGSYKLASADKSLLTENAWQHLAATYDGSSLRLYLNGALINESAGAGTISYNATAPLCVGLESAATACSGANFNGRIDEVKLFSRALSTREITAEYQAQDTGVASGLAIPSVTSGASQTVNFRTSIQTDASSYSLAINQNQNLTSGSNTIPAVSGTIGSPSSWNEGTTKGLGFSLYNTNATAIPAKWNSGSSFAALPNSPMTAYSRTGINGGVKDRLDARLRLDVTSSQPTGNYTNQIGISGTILP